MALNPADIAVVSRLLDQALALPVEEREAWLAALPVEHQAHRDTLRDMLAQEVEFERDSRVAPWLASMPALPADESVAREGDLVGPYRLIGEIGRGGMGSVWLAERVDGNFKRQVALKLPRLAWGTGLAERMAREREIGALLEHPNIARLYDAGVDERGRPYLAFEYIDGQPIDSWCKVQGLGVGARLRLFVQVARAVAYAHGRLVVHRDLKPSNVLVTPDAQTHLLDFGIAKLLHEVAQGEAAITQEYGQAMTPRYASPEQIAGEPITVASDVYSLGVLLYEVLTGELPVASGRSTLGAIEDAILAGDAPLASSRVKDKLTVRALRGEVDAILAKAMRREPGRRYATADALAQDIERHLRGETVTARPDSVVYRLRKAMRRHWVGVSAAAAVLLAVLTGSGLALAQAQRANAEAERARLVKGFVVELFDAKGGPDGAFAQMPAQSLLDRGARTIESRFAGQPLLQAELYGVVGTMFFNLADYQKAIDYRTRQVEALSAVGVGGQALAAAMLGLADVQVETFHWSDARIRIKRALELVGDAADLRVHALAVMAFIHTDENYDLEAAGKVLDEAEAVMARASVPPVERAIERIIRANWLAYKDRVDESLPLYDEAIRLGLAAEGPSSKQAMNARISAAARLVQANRTALADPYLIPALEAMRTIGGPNDVRAAIEESRHASWRFRRNAMPFAQAAAVSERALNAVHSQTWPVAAWVSAEIEGRLGQMYLSWGDVERGAQLVAHATPAWAAQQGSAERSAVLSGMTVAAMLSGKADEADAAVREMHALDKSLWHGLDLAYSYDLLAKALVHARRYADAAAILKEYDGLPGVQPALAKQAAAWRVPADVRLVVALELDRPAEVLTLTDGLAPRDGEYEQEVAWLARAAALCATGRATDGQALFDQWLPRQASKRYDASPHVAYWRARMGLCALSAGHRQQARETSVLASAAIAKQPGVSKHLKAPVVELENRLRRSRG